jgi:hypothetical protein
VPPGRARWERGTVAIAATVAATVAAVTAGTLVMLATLVTPVVRRKM